MTQRLVADIFAATDVNSGNSPNDCLTKKIILPYYQAGVISLDLRAFPMANFVSQFALRALNTENTLRVYSLALENALGANPPPYGEGWFGEKYRWMARDPSWFASLLVSDVDLEGYSAKQLWAYASTVSNPEFAEGLRVH